MPRYPPTTHNESVEKQREEAQELSLNAANTYISEGRALVQLPLIEKTDPKCYKEITWHAGEERHLLATVIARRYLARAFSPTPKRYHPETNVIPLTPKRYHPETDVTRLTFDRLKNIADIVCVDGSVVGAEVFVGEMKSSFKHGVIESHFGETNVKSALRLLDKYELVIIDAKHNHIGSYLPVKNQLLKLVAHYIAGECKVLEFS